MRDTRSDRDDDLKGALEGISDLLSHRVRLGICVLLSRHSALSFSRLKELLEETDGSLGAQLHRLEAEGYLKVEKEFRDRKPITWYSLTASGRKGLKAHFDALTGLIGG